MISQEELQLKEMLRNIDGEDTPKARPYGPKRKNVLQNLGDRNFQRIARAMREDPDLSYRGDND